MNITFNNGETVSFDRTQIKVKDALGGCLYYRYEDGERVYYQKKLKVINNKQEEVLISSENEVNPFENLFIIKEQESNPMEINLLP